MYGFRLTWNNISAGCREILSLIKDLDLTPRNPAAVEYYGMFELVELERNRMECDLRALNERNRCRKIEFIDLFHVSQSDCSTLFE